MCSRRLFLLVSVVLTVLGGCTANKIVTYPVPYTNDTMTRSTDDMVMVHVPEATFALSERGTGGKGTHEVKLDDFWIDKTEISNAHYRQCVETGACQSPTTCAWGEPTYNEPSHANHPVICVSWQMASSYCEWAGGRLPTEAEWDYAARGPERYSYAWGNVFDASNLNFCDVNCSKADSPYRENDDGYEFTAPVGSYPSGASWCGALDMSGNVWEWTSDWFSAYPAGFLENPTGPNDGDERVIRGGSWYDNPDFLRADHRHPFNPNDHNHLIGFRCVLPFADRG